MNNEYYGAPTTTSEDFLAHYGVRGMRWGVRKAKASGNVRRLSRQFAKAEKKLAKLERRANSGKKYAKRAAKLGAGAAVAGGLAAAGTGGIASGFGTAASLAGQGMSRGGSLLKKSKHKRISEIGEAMSKNAESTVKTIGLAGGDIAKWGKETSAIPHRALDAATKVHKKLGGNLTANQIENMHKALGPVSKDTIARIGAGAGYNAYRAATTKRAAKKAARFKSEMNKAFAGTQYAGKAGTTGGKKPITKRR